MNLVSTSKRTVNGTPSLSLKARQGGGVVATLRRNSPNAAMLVDSDMSALKRLLEMAQQDAESLSKGPLTLSRLRQLGHPYGIGARSGGGKRRGLGRIQGNRAGISNINVVNQQSGELAGSWDTELKRDGDGVTLSLTNSAPESAFVAFGTVKMKAHGPFEKALRRQLQVVNREWQRLGRLGADRRRQAERLAMLGSLSLNDLSFAGVSASLPAGGVQRAYSLGFSNTTGATEVIE